MTPTPWSMAARSALVGALLVVPLLSACGVDTQPEPERLPVHVLPTELRPTKPAPTATGR
jgi:hypothetical protein